MSLWNYFCEFALFNTIRKWLFSSPGSTKASITPVPPVIPTPPVRTVRTDHITSSDHHYLDSTELRNRIDVLESELDECDIMSERYDEIQDRIDMLNDRLDEIEEEEDRYLYDGDDNHDYVMEHLLFDDDY